MKPVDSDFEEAWRRAVVLMSSSQEDELLNSELHPHDLLYRLFNEDGVRVFDPLELVKCAADARAAELKTC